MAYNWIGKVEAPNKVLPNVPFKIKFRSWYITIPFIRFKKYSKIQLNGHNWRDEYEVFPWFFIGWDNYTFDCYGIDKDTQGIIEVGVVK